MVYLGSLYGKMFWMRYYVNGPILPFSARWTKSSWGLCLKYMCLLGGGFHHQHLCMPILHGNSHVSIFPFPTLIYLKLHSYGFYMVNKQVTGSGDFLSGPCLLQPHIQAIFLHQYHDIEGCVCQGSVYLSVGLSFTSCLPMMKCCQALGPFPPVQWGFILHQVTAKWCPKQHHRQCISSRSLE